MGQVFQESGDANSDYVSGSQKIELKHFNYARLRVSHLSNISEAELKSCFINLEPYMHPSPVRVPLNATLHQIFNVCRTNLG